MRHHLLQVSILFLIASSIGCQVSSSPWALSHRVASIDEESDPESPLFDDADEEFVSVDDEFEGEDDLVIEDHENTGFWDFLSDRALDALDVASLRVMVGPGLRFNVRATEIVQIGAGFTGPTVGKGTHFSIETYYLGTMRRQGGVWEQRTVERGISTLYHYESKGVSLQGDRSSFGSSDRGFFDIGFVAHAALIGVEAEIRPDEAVDFVLGWFAIDMMGDDRN